MLELARRQLLGVTLQWARLQAVMQGHAHACGQPFMFAGLSL